MPLLKSPAANAGLSLALLLYLAPTAFCREQWQMNHNYSGTSVHNQRVIPGIGHGWVQPIGANFWTGQMAHAVPTGTVLTAVLQDNLNSGKNRPGDTFSMTIVDGFRLDTRELVPPNSRIIGTVIAVVPAAAQRQGMPGTMDVSLQSLVFADGRQLPIFASIDANPTKVKTGPPKIRYAGADIRDYGDSLRAMGRSFVTGPGFMMNRLNRGLEFEVDAGQTIPVRLNRSLEIPDPPPMTRQQSPTQANGTPPYNNLSTAPSATFAQPQGQRKLSDMADPF